MIALFWIALVAASCFAIDKAALWAEAKGWIYWRKKKAQTSSMSSILSEMNIVTNPAAQHVVEAKDKKKFEERQNGDDDPPR